MKLFVLDGRRMTSREAAHAYLARELGFPPYYGGNLDALADCLRELGSGVCVALLHADALRAESGGFGARLLAVFENVSAEPASFRWIAY